jgi:multidrug efflux pump subunit AcrA (membrane-fusion protein)
MIRLQSDLENARLARAKEEFALLEKSLAAGEISKEDFKGAETALSHAISVAHVAAANRQRAELEAAELNLQRQQKLLDLGSGRKAEVARAERKLAELKAQMASAAMTSSVERPVATILTLTRVRPQDPAFRNPTKFIGPFYEEAEAKRLEQERDELFGIRRGRVDRGAVGAGNGTPSDEPRTGTLARLAARTPIGMVRVERDHRVRERNIQTIFDDDTNH